MTYEIVTGQFHGPMDALLDLVEERKLSINDISLAAVMNEFIAYSRSLNLSRAEAAAFLAVASTLILIKSRSLLPSLTLTAEEAESIDELEARLTALRDFRRLSRNFREAQTQGAWMSREAFHGRAFGFWPDDACTSAVLAAFAHRLVDSFSRPAALPEAILRRAISIEEKARELLNRIGDRVVGSLETIVAGADTAETIVGFLAILELIKQGLFFADQKNVFGDIELKRL